MASSTHAPFGRPWSAAAASLVPWAAFLVATALTDIWVDYSSRSFVGLIAASPAYLGFVALPSLLPLAAAPPGWMRVTVLTVMTAVAVIAAVLVVSSDDAQARLAVLLVPYVAVPLGTAVWVAQTVLNARKTASPERAEDAVSSLARPSERLAALVIDFVVVGVVLVVPLTAMSHAKQEVAAGVVGVAAGTIYLGGHIAAFGRTPGQSVLRLRVVDARTGARIGLARAFLRSTIVVLEVAAAPTLIIAIPGLVELTAAAADGRSLTDRLLRTAVARSR
jgi:RDD family